MGLEAYGFIGLTGQEVSRFEIPWEGAAPEKEAVRLEGPAVETDRIRYIKETRGAAPGDVTDVVLEGGTLKITVLPATTRADFTLVVGDRRIGRDEFTLHTRTADEIGRAHV